MSEGPKANYYEVLEINENANPDEIRKSYRRLALKWHPDKNENKREAEEKFKLINKAYAVLSDKTKKKEYDDFRKYGAAGRGFEFSHFRRNFDPFEAFRTFFQDEAFGFDDEDDIFSRNNIFRRFGGFGGGFDRGFNKHFDRDFGDFGGFGESSNFAFSSSSSSSTGGIGAATTKSVKKTTQIINGQRVTKTETTTIDKNGNKKVEITEEIDNGRGSKSTNTKQLYEESNGINNKKQIR